MNTGDTIQIGEILFTVDGACGHGFHPCKGCDARRPGLETDMIPASYCAALRKRGCAGAACADADRDPLDSEMVGAGFIFVAQPCDNMPYWKRQGSRWIQIKSYPEVLV